MIKINNLKKLYGDRTVLDIKSLEIKKGECVVLTGHNGSGKSTFLKILAGTENKTEGDVFTKGQIYYLPQQSLPFNKSVKSNILYCLEGRKSEKNELCEKFDITDEDFIGRRIVKMIQSDYGYHIVMRYENEKGGYMLEDNSDFFVSTSGSGYIFMSDLMNTLFSDYLVQYKANIVVDEDKLKGVDMKSVGVNYHY